MSDLKKFLSESHLFVAELESVASEVEVVKSKRVQVILKNIKPHYNGIINSTSSAAMVEELKVFCLDLSKWEIPELEPAIDRYVKILDNINLDLIEEIELQQEIPLLQNHLGIAVKRIEDITVRVDGSKISYKGTKLKMADRAASSMDSKETVFDAIIPDEGRKLPEPTLRVRFSGDKVKGRTVEQGASCVLSVDWGLLDDKTLVDLTGNELQRAREAELEVEFVLYSGLFMVEGNKTLIATRFKDDGFETPVTFNLTAPEAPTVKPNLTLEIEIHGRPAVRIPILLTVVQDLSTVSEGDSAVPVKVDLDKLIADSKRPIPTATLRINSATSHTSASLTIQQPYSQGIDTGYKPALMQTSLANRLGIIAGRMGDVALHPIWNLLTDPLNPTGQDKPGLSEPLARAAAAGYELYEWLESAAGMKDILGRIDTLPPGSRIIVHSDGVAIPWETIYPVRYCFIESDDDHAAYVDPRKFWGYRFEFETILSPREHELPVGDISDRIEQHRNAKRMLTAVMNGDIDTEGKTRGWSWKAGPPVDYQRMAFTKAFSDVPAKIHDKSACADARKLLYKEPTSGLFIYFYCHGGAEKPFAPELEAVLQIDKSCMIRLVNVSTDHTFTDAPIVFLNSCSSGQLAPVSFDSFCARFLHKGALGMITTSFGVPAPFAARFGCELILRYMNAEETLGEILLDMRKKALDQRIPIGLFYMLMGPGDVSLKPN